MKIKLWKVVDKQIEKDVSFPIYRKCRLSDDCMSYTRINGDLTAITINEETFVGGGYEYQLEYEIKYDFDRSEIKYHLGLFEHQLTKDEFDNVFNIFIRRIDELKIKCLTK